MKKAVAWLMLAGSATGSALSFAQVVGKGEPQLVLQLSWFALLIPAAAALLIEHGD